MVDFNRKQLTVEDSRMDNLDALQSGDLDKINVREGIFEFPADKIPGEGLVVKNNSLEEESLKRSAVARQNFLEERERLLAATPDRKLMEQEIVRKLREKLISLEEDINKLATSLRKNIEVFTETVASSRKTYYDLNNLERLTYEEVKNFWLDVVHGITE